MGTKKKAAGGGDEQQELKERNDLLASEITLLKWQIAMEQEKADRSRAGQNECKQKMKEIHDGFEEESKQAFTNISDMKAQYSSMVKDRDEKIESLETELKEVTGDLHGKERDIREMIKSKDREIDDKDQEIRELLAHVVNLFAEFANMLKTTLDKMQERIELANTQYDAEDAV